jgi:hypothetical protein
MFNKIQPEQLQLPTFFSASGDFLLSDLNTGFKIELKRDLVGDFDFSGNLTVNNSQVLTTASSTVFNSNSGMLIGGTNNTIGGEYNVVINGNNNTIYGEDNTILFSDNSTFETGSQQNMLIGGNTVTFESGVVGSTMMGDDTAIRTVDQSRKLILDFASGQRFINDTVFEDDVTVSGNLTISGDRVTRFLDVTGISGAGSIIENDGSTSVGQGIIVFDLGGKKIRVTGQYI